MNDVDKEFLEEYKGKRINIIMKNGYQQKGTLTNFDSETLLITTSEITNKKALVYRNNISTIKTE